MQTPKEVFEAMNATKILVAILENQKVVSIPLDVFLNAGSEQKNLNVEYNEDEKQFVFQLKENSGQEANSENVETESNE